MELLLSLLAFALIVGLLIWLVQRLPLPAPFGMVAECVIVLLAIVWLVERFGLFSGSARL